MKDRDEDMLLGAALEMAAASSPFLSVDLTVQQGLVLLGAMQLALRHTYLAASIRETLKALADEIECQLSSVGPCVREIARRGWEYHAPLFAA